MIELLASRPDKVFGIGLSRTGTQSLAAALDVLGWRCIHFPCDARTFQQLSAGDLRLDVLEVYTAICDTPVVPYFERLDRLYPGAKFILTTRKPSDWHRSCERFWREDAESQERPFERFINAAVYGVTTYNEEQFDVVYRRHLSRVYEYFRRRPGGLLTLDICGGMGWRELCQFLSVAVPDKDFPHVR